MKKTRSFQSYSLLGALGLSLCLSAMAKPAAAAVPAANSMQNYCVKPPFVSQSVPPMVMFEVGRDHKLYYEAYNDGVDLDGDGRIDRTYDHSIEYYGYFHPYKCYTPASGSSSNDYFTAVATNTDRFCSTGQMGGNILNWMTMSRMDVLRKVMYGGQRTQESPRILLDRAYIPQDAHSWGKEYTGKLCYNGTSGVYKNMCYAAADCDSGFTCTDKSDNLLGMVAPTGGAACSGFTITWGTATQGEKKLLVVRYPNTAGRTGSDHNDIINAFDTTQFYPGFSPQYVTDFSDTILDPTVNHGDNYAQVIVSEFQVANSNAEAGTWSFAIDGDDGVEMVLTDTSGNVITPASTTATSPYIAYYGAHGPAGDQSHYGTYTLAKNTWYRMVVRHVEGSGGDGVKVWYKKPADSAWSIYGYKKNTLTVRSPDIVVGNNDCTLRNTTFRDIGAPYNSGLVLDPPKRHLVCNTTLSSGVPSNNDGATSIMRIKTNENHRIWEWASKERPVCDDTFTDGSSATANRTDYTVQVEACKPGVGTLSMDDRFERCRSYGGTFNASTRTYTGGSYVPAGLFQKYGEVEFNNSGNPIKVCSKSMGKVCSGDNDCGTGEGLCFTKAPMYFGLMTTTYTKNTSGGVLRKNPGPVFDEVVDTNGKRQTSENERGNLINSIDRMRVIDFDYGSHSYSNCGWIENRPINEGECKMWGNPIAEMMYESLRYFAGKGTTSGGGETPAYDYSTTADSGVNLSKPKWGYNKGSTYYKPFEIFPSCSQPFLLILSDVNTSFDSDQIPGTAYGTFAEDAALPQLGLGETQADGKSLLNSLTDFIGQVEGINGNSWFIGESGGSTDFICSAKTVTNLSAARGICTEEPTKKGSYYAAALAYYGKNNFAAKTGKGAVSTFVLAMSSPFADIKVKAGSGFVSVVPVGKSVYGDNVNRCLGYSTCSLTELTTADGKKHYKVTGCPTDAFCPTNSLVDFYIDDMKYDSSNNVIYSKFRINFEDVEQGADHDMDAIASYELCTQAASTANYGSCTGTISGLQVKVKSEYAAGSISQLLGFVISGTTEDGTYLVTKDVDTGSGAISGLPIEWSKTYTVSSTGAAGYLKNPLWYAAKWGGFTGTGYPQSTSQWDKNNDGLPDTYFPVSNPLLLDEQLEKALNEILSRVASGTAASILNNSEGSGANLLQAVFYPKKPFDNGTEANWVGEMQNLWYYLDPFFQKTSIREDSDQNFTLNLKTTVGVDPPVGDKVAQFYFDKSDNQTKVKLFHDVNGDGSADTLVTTITPDNVNSLWKAGRLLWGRDLSSSGRVIKTHSGLTGVDSSTTGLVDLSTLPSLTAANAGLVEAMMQTTAAEKANLVTYLYGTDITGFRSRMVTITSCSNNRNKNCSVNSDCSGGGTCVDRTSEWRLGDIVSSTPKLVSNVRLNAYSLPSPNGYDDLSYQSFVDTTTYKNRGMVFVGGNDGMLHAFKLGILKELNGKYEKAKMVNSSGATATASDNLGQEMWNFIPRNALPYLTYLKDPNYCHLFYIDKTSSIFDISIGDATVGTDVCTASSYFDCAKDSLRWKTVLIGGMGTGGACRNSTNTCGADGCVKTPISNVGFSSYFALDVTDPENPNYMWEFPNISDTTHAAAIGTGAGTLGGLGFSTTGPAIVRIAARVKDVSNNYTNTPDNSKNGKWFAVFASGPTGPINTSTQEFLGQSDQTLKLFIVDLRTGSLLRTIDTGIANAYAGSLSSSWVDTDRASNNSTGYYSDDAVYIGYVKKDAITGTWTKGGVLRLVTKDNTKDSLDPANWAWSTLIDGTGPVTTSVTKLQDRKNKNFWIYFGTGRYAYKQDDPSTGTRQRLYGVKEPCYSTTTGPVNDLDASCTATVSNTSADCSGILSNAAFTLGATALCDQSGTTTDAPLPTLPTNASGWFINLDAAVTGTLAERVITDPIASPSGALFFTTLKPSGDVCRFGGDSLVWAARYDSGGVPPARAMQGKALMQVSTGAFAEISLATAFSNPGDARLDGRRLDTPISGVPPTSQGLSLITNPPAAKKFLHVREK